MTQGGEARAQPHLLTDVQGGGDHPRIVRLALREHLAPGVHDHAVAPGLTTVGVASRLGGGDWLKLKFSTARARLSSSQ